jgi:hypothetical protein
MKERKEGFIQEDLWPHVKKQNPLFDFISLLDKENLRCLCDWLMAVESEVFVELFCFYSLKLLLYFSCFAKDTVCQAVFIRGI